MQIISPLPSGLKVCHRPPLLAWQKAFVSVLVGAVLVRGAVAFSCGNSVGAAIDTLRLVVPDCHAPIPLGHLAWPDVG